MFFQCLGRIQPLVASFHAARFEDRKVELHSQEELETFCAELGEAGVSKICSFEVWSVHILNLWDTQMYVDMCIYT